MGTVILPLKLVFSASPYEVSERCLPQSNSNLNQKFLQLFFIDNIVTFCSKFRGLLRKGKLDQNHCKARLNLDLHSWSDPQGRHDMNE